MISSTLTTIRSPFDSPVTPIAKPAFIIGLVYAIINWKTLPFVWHISEVHITTPAHPQALSQPNLPTQIRILNGYILHYHLGRQQIPPSSPQSPTIFRPTIYCTSVPPGEIDYSLHKSNSTYLTDVDIARGYHIYTVCYDGFKRWSAQGKRILTPMLGGTTCTFKPFPKVEVWTRVLSWDEKWVYLVSHFAKLGRLEKEKEEASPLVYATCVSKIVLKPGRKTVMPRESVKLAGLTGGLDREDRDEDWKGINRTVERRREEGMRLAAHVAALDEGHGHFVGVDGGDVLASY